MLKPLAGYDQRVPRLLKLLLYSRQPGVTSEMEHETAPGRVALSARAPLAICAHSRHATHWFQSRLPAQDSSETWLAYVFSSGPHLYCKRTQLVGRIQSQANRANSFVPDFDRSSRF